MRHTKNVSKDAQKNLETQFSNIAALFQGDTTTDYKLISASVFEEWLNDAEAKNEIPDNGDNHGAKISFERNNKLHKFIEAISTKTACYKVRKTGIRKKNVQYKTFTSPNSASVILKPKPYHHSDKARFILVLPDYDAVYFESSDYTHHIYYRDERVINLIRTTANESDLHILTSK